MKFSAICALALLCPLAALTWAADEQKIEVDPSNVRQLPPNTLPNIVSVTPEQGALEVDPDLKEIVVKFDREMDSGFSWTGGGAEFPGSSGHRPVWRDKRTCVLPVQLEARHFYRFGINSPSHQNFRSAEGMPVRPRVFYFVTKGAGEAVLNLARQPKVVKMEPPNGATGVDPKTGELKVTFDMPMAGSFSWMRAGGEFPPAPAGQRASWSADRKTCALPVGLKAGTEYRLGLNGTNRFHFQSTNGIPIDPVIYTFTTAGPQAR